MAVSTTLASRLRRWALERSVATLLVNWLLAYVMLALMFGIAYLAAPGCTVSPSGRTDTCERDLATLLYFSFTTQATVGYGDYVPLGLGRWITVVQAFIGLTMNALILGIATFKALKPQAPIVFSRFLVYDPQSHEHFRVYKTSQAAWSPLASQRLKLINPTLPALAH